MSCTLFHVTPESAAILAAGFVNSDGTQGLGDGDRVGVILHDRSRLPVSGGHVLAVTLTNALDVASYASDTHGSGITWCVPADVVNSTAETRLLAQSEVDEQVTNDLPDEPDRVQGPP